MRSITRFSLVVTTAAAAFLGGTYWGSTSPTASNWFAAARYEVRKTIGLPKFWFPIPAGSPKPADLASACPDPKRAIVLVTGGQSNAANSNSKASETQAGDNVVTWHEGRCYIARDPVPGAAGTMGSLWPLMGLNLARSTGRPVLLVNGAISGTQVNDWLDPRSGYYEALTKRVVQARSAGYEANVILWHQGETDALVDIDVDALTRDLQRLTQKLLNDMPQAKLYLFRASKCIGEKRKDGVQAVTTIQTLAAKGNERIVQGLNTDTLDNDNRWDGCHFNSRGRDRIVELVVPEISSLIVDKP